MLTPGVRVSKSSNFRPRTGVVAMVTSLSVVVDEAVVMSTSGADVTMTCCDVPATCSVSLSEAVWPTVRVRFCIVDCLGLGLIRLDSSIGHDGALRIDHAALDAAIGGLHLRMHVGGEA